MPRITTPVIDEAVRVYIKTCGLSPRVKDDRRSLLLRLARHVGHVQVASITPAQVSAFMADIDVARSTHMKYRSHLAKFFAFCQVNGWLRRDLLTLTPRHKVGRRRVRWQLDAHEVKRLLDSNADDPRDHALIVTALNTGLRISEIARLTFGDVNLRRGRLLEHMTKAGQEDDSVRITPTLDAELRSYLTWYADEIGRPLRRADYLFPGRTRPMYVDGKNRVQVLNPAATLKNRDQIIQRAFANADFEVEAQEGWHTIRRTSARMIFDRAGAAGRDNALRITMAFLHHASQQTTERYLGETKEMADRDSLLETDPFAIVPAETAPNVIPLNRRAGNG